MTKPTRWLLCGTLILLSFDGRADEQIQPPFKWAGHLRNTMAHMLTVAVSPNQKLLAAGSGFGGGPAEVIVWDLETRQQKFSVPMDQTTVRNVAFSPDGKLLAAATFNRKLTVFDASDGKIIHQLEGHTNHLNAVAFSPDGKTIASAGLDKTVRLWNAETGEQLKQIAFPVQAFGVAFSSDGKYLAACGQNANVKVYSPDGSKELHSLAGHEGHAEVAAFSPDSKVLATCSWDDSIILWNPADGSQIAKLQGKSGDVMSVCFTSDGKHVIGATSTGVLTCWNATTHELVASRPTNNKKIWGLCPLPDGRQFASAAVGHKLVLWNLVADADGTTTLNVGPALVRPPKFRDTNTAVLDAVHEQNDRWLATANKAGEIHIRQPRTGFIDQAFDHAGVTCLAVDRTGALLASASSDGTVCIWHVASGRKLSTLHGQTQPVYSLAFSPTRSILAVGTQNRELQLLDFDIGRVLSVAKEHGDLVRSISFSRDGNFVATGCDDMLIRVFEVSTGKLVRTLRGHSGIVRAVVFLPDGNRLASASADLSVRIWDLKSGKALYIMKEHKSIVWALACSPDGTSLLSGGFDGAIRKWSTKDGKLLQKVRTQPGGIQSISISPNGDSFVGATLPGQLIRWRTQYPTEKISSNDQIAYTPNLASPRVTPLKWEDGPYEFGEISNSKTVKGTGYFVYFAIDDSFSADLPSPDQDRYFLTAQVYDHGRGSVNVQYDGHPRPGQSEDASRWVATRRVQMRGQKKWVTVSFELVRPRFANRQNADADFRFCGTANCKPEIRNVEIRRIRIPNTTP